MHPFRLSGVQRVLERLKLARQPAIAAPRPILIIGSGRSGTTALTWALGQHPNIIAVPETNWLTALASYLGAIYDIGAANDQAHLAVFGIDRRAFFLDFGRAVDTFVRDSFEAKFPDRRKISPIECEDGIFWTLGRRDPKRRWADGTPSNTPYVSTIAQMLPEARFINLVRKPVDVVHSWLGVPWRAPEHADPRALIDHIRHSQRIGYLAEAVLGTERIKRIFLEDLAREPEAQMRAICAFIEEVYTAPMITPFNGMKINSTGARKDDFKAELESVRDDPLLHEMEAWYKAAQDPDWRIAEPEDAVKELTMYANWKIPVG